MESSHIERLRGHNADGLSILTIALKANAAGDPKAQDAKAAGTPIIC
jgi:hypothetical protein